MQKNICLIFGLYPRQLGEFYYYKCKTLQNAANALQWGYVKGLENYYNKVNLINLPMVPSFPMESKIFKLDFLDFSYNNVNAINVSYVNLIYYKYFSIYHNAKKHLKDWIKKDKSNRVIIVYGQYSPYLKACFSLKNNYKDLIIINIIPDIPKFMGFGSSIRYKLVRKVNEYIIKKDFQKIDGFVLLTKDMYNILNINNRPFTVIEGIYNEIPISKEIKLYNIFYSDKKIVFYSGDLTEVYGIKNLVNAFHRIKNDNYRLVICGKGDSEEYIREMSSVDSRIIFLGLVQREVVLEMEKKSTLLVNPRDKSGEYTKYSFPSKTMEYLSSGTPVLMCKLPGIPNEYYDKCFCVDVISEDVLEEKIKEILNMDTKVLNDIGIKAKDFILNEKNPLKQCEKLYKLIESL